MGKILDAVFGRFQTDEATRPARSRPNGSTIGLTTPTTIRGNTVMGPSGGRATRFATTTPSGQVTNVRNITQSDYRSASKPQKSNSDRGGNKLSSTTSSRGRSSEPNNARSHEGPSGVGRGSGGTNRMKSGGPVGKKNWIQSAIGKPGSLRSALKVKKGATIPAKKLAAAAKKPGKIGQKARLAQTLKSFKKSK